MAKKANIQKVLTFVTGQLSTQVRTTALARLCLLGACWLVTRQEKGVLQTLAVLGKDIPLDLVRHMTPLPEGELSRICSDRQAGEFIYEREPQSGLQVDLFAHALGVIGQLLEQLEPPRASCSARLELPRRPRVPVPGFRHIFVARQAAVDRLPQQVDQLRILAPARIAKEQPARSGRIQRLAEIYSEEVSG